MYDIVIIGSGPAGMTAGLYAARAGLRAVVFERLFAGGQVATTGVVENYPGFPGGIDGPELSEKIAEQAQSLGLEMRYEDVTALVLNSEVKEVTTAKGVLTARAVILCMGAAPRMLGAPGEEALRGAGVSYCATCDGAFYRGKRVAVVGGGDTAVEDARYLAALCSEVLLIHRRDRLRAVGVLAEKMLELPNVRPVWNAQVTAILGDKAVRAVSLDVAGNAREEALDGVFVAVGNVPNTSLVRGQVELDDQGYIRAGEDTRTSLRGVYAAGDIRSKPLRQIVTATSDGALAVHAALADMTEGNA